MLMTNTGQLGAMQPPANIPGQFGQPGAPMMGPGMGGPMPPPNAMPGVPPQAQTGPMMRPPGLMAPGIGRPAMAQQFALANTLRRGPIP